MSPMEDYLSNGDQRMARGLPFQKGPVYGLLPVDYYLFCAESCFKNGNYRENRENGESFNYP